MSSPKPLSELIKEWREQADEWDKTADSIQPSVCQRSCADELEQWAEAWSEQLPEKDGSMFMAFVRERILGLPAKTP